MKILRVIITLTRGRYRLGQDSLKLRNPWFDKEYVDTSKIKRCKISIKKKKKKYHTFFKHYTAKNMITVGLRTAT